MSYELQKVYFKCTNKGSIVLRFYAL